MDLFFVFAGLIVVVLTGLYFSAEKRNSKSYLFKGFNKEMQRGLLSQHFILYRLNDREGKSRFEKRIIKFIKNHRFICADSEFCATDELKLLIAGAAVQITYGYPDVYLRYFSDIIIYDREFYSASSGKYHEGEVHSMGAIVLSINNIEKGLGNPADGRNLLLHEMAHALLLDNLVGSSTPSFLDSDNIYSFQQLAMVEMERMTNGLESFFRDYGSTNFQEFFAVSVECFFEQTEGFYNYNPELYDALARLLNIDLLFIRKRTIH